MQVGEIDGGASRSVERHKIGFQLDQVARDEAGSQTEVAQALHQKPRRIAAGAFGQRQRFLGRMNAGFHADDVADFAGEAGIQAHDEIDGSFGGAGDRGQECREQRPGGFGGKIDGKVRRDIFGIGEGKGFGGILDEEIKRVIHGHIRHQIDLDAQFADRFGKDVAGQPVAIGVLLIIHEVVGRADPEAVRHHAGTAVGGGA